MRDIKYLIHISLGIMCFWCSGCSVGMAMSGNEQYDTSVLFIGSPRAVVIAKMGPPETTIKSKDDGTYTDSYYIVKGNKPSAGRAVAHAGMDLLTLGLWEAVGTPLEMGAAKEDYMRYIIYYDTDDNIENVQKIAVGEEEGDT